MTDHAHDAHGANDHGKHAPPGVGKYVVVALALLVLTGISFGAYELLHDRPAAAWTVMMSVSCCKAMLVILFFMHLKWEANWKYVLTFPATAMSIFLLVMLVPDIGLRMRRYSEERRERAAVPASLNIDSPDSASHAAHDTATEAAH